MNNKILFKRFGTMIDCSRNAVMTVDALKKWIELISKMGYNTLYLYTEDTYEVEDNPYFGYLRGKYTRDEIREIVAHADRFGMEVIPCIQTLAHLENYKRWDKTPYDIDDIMLAGDEKVYELIDKMFKSISETYTTKTINVGMDEAQNLGRGAYADIHGNRERRTILLEHLGKVAQIAKKYGFTLGMWSDMFFTAFTGQTYDPDIEFGDDVKSQIPDNVELIYWDYETKTVESYDSRMKAHERLKPGYWFASGLSTWLGFAPHNIFASGIVEKAMTACRMNGVTNVMITMWGDNGGECSRFASLPSVFYASEIAKGITDEATIKEDFYKMFSVSYDDFTALDMASALLYDGNASNAEKYLLYNDPFLGIFDSTMPKDIDEKFTVALEKLNSAKPTDEWKYLFDTSRTLAKILTRKASLGIKTREAYENKDLNGCRELAKVYAQLSEEVGEFYKYFRKQWFSENKANGFEVQDIRLGGLMLRLKHLSEVLTDYADGKLKNIPELEEKTLDYFGNGEDFKTAMLNYRSWSGTVTANTI